MSPRCEYSAEPEAYFRIAPEDWLWAEMQGEIVALVHNPREVCPG
ncbi:phage tail protein [Escherichia coli]|nr:phage tail protein [Escherichia coli]